MKRVCVITGTRAEYGLLYWTMKHIQDSKDFELQICATGMHLSPEFGLTYQQIEVDGFFINEKIDISKVETQNTWNLAQSRIKSAGLQNDAELNKVVQDFISSSREDGSLSGRETVIIAVSKSNKNLN